MYCVCIFSVHLVYIMCQRRHLYSYLYVYYFLLYKKLCIIVCNMLYRCSKGFLALLQ